MLNDDLKGKKVCVKLTDKTYLYGTVKAITPYEIELFSLSDIEREEIIYIFKHSILWIKAI